MEIEQLTPRSGQMTSAIYKKKNQIARKRIVLHCMQTYVIYDGLHLNQEWTTKTRIA